MIGQPSQALNLRYLACLLRIADVLEFDPERTPQVIFRHRSVAPGSAIFWAKDQGISLTLGVNPPGMYVAARTSNAAIHKAVLDTINQVNDELAVCSVLKEERAFDHGVIVGRDNVYTWPWPSRVTEDVAPRLNSFAYIEGSFRPNTQRLLQLLGGIALYKSPFAAVRELLQNAFDAVLESIAY